MAQESPSPTAAVRSQPEPVRFPGQRKPKGRNIRRLKRFSLSKRRWKSRLSRKLKFTDQCSPAPGRPNSRWYSSAISGWNRVRQNNPVR